MTAFLLRRLLQGVAIVFTVATVTFALVHAAPGEPFAATLDDPRVTAEMQATLRRQYGLDQPLLTQYVRYLGQVARADLGLSLGQLRPVRTILGEAFPRTLLLLGVALAGGFTLGMVVGVVQAARRGSRFDRIATRASVALAAIPDFWLALLLLLVFALRLRWFPIAGMVDPTMHDYLPAAGKVRDVLHHLVLPATTVALLIAAVVARHQREALLEALPDDYVRSARAKGVPERAVLARHALRNALRPTVTLVGLALPALAGGAVFVEVVFAWPGMGRLAVEALAARDYPLVLGTTMAGSVLVVAGTLLADLLAAAIDPRLRDG